MTSDADTANDSASPSPIPLSLSHCLCAVGLPSPTPSYTSTSASPTTSTTSTTSTAQTSAHKPLVFVTNTVHRSRIEKPRDVTFIIRAFIKYIQHAKAPYGANGRSIRNTADMNSLLFDRYMHDFLTTLNIIGYNLPGQPIAYTVRLTLAFHGPFLLYRRARRPETGPRYSCRAEIELAFFSTRPADAASVAELDRLLVAYLVHNSQLLRLAQLQLPNHWMLNTVHVKTACTDADR